MASDYDDGVEAGKILERLNHHDQHFVQINGSIDNLVQLVGEVKLQVQRLADQAVARDATVIATAAALKDADETRRNLGEQKWTPVTRTITIILAAATVAGVIIAWLSSR